VRALCAGLAQRRNASFPLRASQAPAPSTPPLSLPTAQRHRAWTLSLPHLQSAELEGSSAWPRTEMRLTLSLLPSATPASRCAGRRHRPVHKSARSSSHSLAKNKRKETLARDSKRAAPRVSRVAYCSRLADTRTQVHKSARSSSHPLAENKKKETLARIETRRGSSESRSRQVIEGIISPKKFETRAKKKKHTKSKRKKRTKTPPYYNA
jgi:hypothetical protein